MPNATLQLTNVHSGADDIECGAPDEFGNARVVDAALRQCDGGLDFVESALARFSLADADRASLAEQIGIIRRRRLDPNFYLALVGEFSSGKSTFINALLGEELLPAGASPITSAVTKICYSRHFSVQVSSRRNGDQSVTLCSPEVPVAEIVAFLSTLMTDAEKAADIAEICVGYPSAFLAGGIVIVDTPGFNVPDAGHAEITQQVVGLIADCAVVVTPANCPMSLVLGNFLDDYLKPYLHRCVYIVTKMDQLREKDRSAVLSYVRRRLEDRLGLSGVAIHPVAAQVKLDSLCSSDIPSSESVWVERFQLFEKELVLRVKRERTIAIAERIARLQYDALGRIEDHLKQAAERFDQRKTGIAAEFIPDVPAFTLQQRSMLESGLRSISDQALDTVSKGVASHRKFSSEHIRDSIFSAPTTDAVTAAYHAGLTLLQGEASTTKEELGRVLSDVQYGVLAAMKTFDKRFEQTYERLEQATGETLLIPALPSQGMEVELSRPAAHVPNLPNLPYFHRIRGWIFGEDINVWRDRAWKVWEPEVSWYFSRIEREARDACTGYLEATGTSLDGRIRHYVDTYSQIVATIMEREDREVLRMRMLSTLTNLYALEAQRQAMLLLKAKEDLAALG